MQCVFPAVPGECRERRRVPVRVESVLSVETDTAREVGSVAGCVQQSRHFLSGSNAEAPRWAQGSHPEAVAQARY